MKHLRALDEKIAVAGSVDPFDKLDDKQQLVALLAHGLAHYNQHVAVEVKEEGVLVYRRGDRSFNRPDTGDVMEKFMRELNEVFRMANLNVSIDVDEEETRTINAA